MKKCAMLSMDSLEGFETYDWLLDEPMQALGWQIEMVSWRDTSVNWSNYEVVIIRSTWDYQDDMTGFVRVLSDIEHSSARLENSLDVVQWNINKSYLSSRPGINLKEFVYNLAESYDYWIYLLN